MEPTFSAIRQYDEDWNITNSRKTSLAFLFSAIRQYDEDWNIATIPTAAPLPYFSAIRQYDEDWNYVHTGLHVCARMAFQPFASMMRIETCFSKECTLW